MQKGRRNENILERSRQWMEIKSINIYSAETSIKHFQCNLNNKFSLKTSRSSFSFYMQEWKEHRGERLHIGQWEGEEKSLRSSEIYKHICGMQSYVGAASVCYHTHWAAEPKRLEKCFTAFSHVVRCEICSPGPFHAYWMESSAMFVDHGAALLRAALDTLPREEAESTRRSLRHRLRLIKISLHAECLEA